MKKFIILKHDRDNKVPEVNPPLPMGPPSALLIPIQQIKTEEVPKTNKLQETCRDYLRGWCKRENNCKFLHRATTDHDELVKVYKFCHNYQNSRCTYTKCKYIHATVMEEMAFYRKGVLPAHILAELAERERLPPPQPPTQPQPQPQSTLFLQPPPPPPPRPRPILLLPPPPPPPPPQPEGHPQVPPPALNENNNRKRPWMDPVPFQPHVPPPTLIENGFRKRPRMDAESYGTCNRKCQEYNNLLQSRLEQYEKMLKVLLQKEDNACKRIIQLETILQLHAQGFYVGQNLGASLKSICSSPTSTPRPD